MKEHTFDVRHYGAKMDGATDDTAAIQRALDEAAKATGTVLFPVGNYRISTPKVPGGVK